MTTLPLITGAMKKGAVIGDPIGQSRSPSIMARWLGLTGIDGAYNAFHITPERLDDQLAHLHGLGYDGLNITLPHKQAVIRHCHTLSARAQSAGAVNLLIRSDKGWLGDNTDVEGLVGPLSVGQQHHHALILGAGGAAGGAITACRMLGIGKIVVTARRIEAAEAIASRTQGVAAATWQEALAGRTRADLVINATPIGMWTDDAQTWPSGVYDNARTVFDMVYAKRQTMLISGAISRGLTVCDGFDMLVAQARGAFAAIFGKPAPQDNGLAALLRADVQQTPC
jgi:shikimate dehydrogenase